VTFPGAFYRAAQAAVTNLPAWAGRSSSKTPQAEVDRHQVPRADGYIVTRFPAREASSAANGPAADALGVATDGVSNGRAPQATRSLAGRAVDDERVSREARGK